MTRFCRMFNNRVLFERLSKVSPAAVRLFGLLVERADWRLGSYVAPENSITDALGLTDRSIQRANKELIEIGLIKYKRGGIYAINPEFVWGGRSWNIVKASYYTMGSKAAQVINITDIRGVLNMETGEIEGHETLREVSARKSKGPKAC
ncbi:hypothetical protein WB66_06470 [bacteria symbiont BFo1 of Frankliniella occidentalis]|nr:hypothetical protein AI28_05790 [bacteria symbiont BFo1 of Frankliniella occidentalis]KYP85592.1 hypothetical protein WB66_06470 [bacteria symbiont BFo1 of Frankliniella occidentalis]KYP91421.1 hypothetical protein WB91_05730 [bacteria symbiont BFo1 of Frankliniella occidentalis]